MLYCSPSFSVTNVDRRTTTYNYDKLGRLIERREDGHRWRFAYYPRAASTTHIGRVENR